MKHALPALAAMLAACAASPSHISESAFVRLSRGPCFGRCPVYSVSMDARGLVQFEGKRNVAQAGAHEQQRAKEDFAALLRDLDASGVFGMSGSYVPGNTACGQYATDMPSAALQVSDGKREVRVEHYLGCSNAPAALSKLEDLVDERTGALHWIKDAPSF